MSELGMIPNPADEVDPVSFVIFARCDGEKLDIGCPDYQLCPDCFDPEVCRGVGVESAKVHKCPCAEVV